MLATLFLLLAAGTLSRAGDAKRGDHFDVRVAGLHRIFIVSPDLRAFVQGSGVDAAESANAVKICLEALTGQLRARHFVTRNLLPPFEPEVSRVIGLAGVAPPFYQPFVLGESEAFDRAVRSLLEARHADALALVWGQSFHTTHGHFLLHLVTPFSALGEDISSRAEVRVVVADKRGVLWSNKANVGIAFDDDGTVPDLVKAALNGFAQ